MRRSTVSALVGVCVVGGLVAAGGEGVTAAEDTTYYRHVFRCDERVTAACPTPVPVPK